MGLSNKEKMENSVVIILISIMSFKLGLLYVLTVTTGSPFPILDIMIVFNGHVWLGIEFVFGRDSGRTPLLGLKFISLVIVISDQVLFSKQMTIHFRLESISLFSLLNIIGWISLIGKIVMVSFLYVHHYQNVCWRMQYPHNYGQALVLSAPHYVCLIM